MQPSQTTAGRFVMYVKTPEEILVTLPHTRLLVGALDEAGVAHLVAEEGMQLGLARVQIDDDAAVAADAVAEWRQSAGASADDHVIQGREPDPASIDYNLDRLLRDLRAVFRH